MKDQTAGSQRGEVLVAIMNNERDFGILSDELWYRIPVDKAPRRWPPEWLSFYQTKVFGDDRWAVNYYGRVKEIRTVSRRELLPEDPLGPKSDRLYYQLRLHSLERLPHPIVSPRWRRIVFISSTWDKFRRAAQINDLYDDSPLEDRLWEQFRRLRIEAERQWRVNIGRSLYFLDFALFCLKGNIDVETDGDTWHADPRRIPKDNRRANDLEVNGWHVLRFNGHHVREKLEDYCLPTITEMINELDGLSDEGLVPRRLFHTSEGYAEQLRLLESPAEYDFD